MSIAKRQANPFEKIELINLTGYSTDYQSGTEYVSSLYNIDNTLYWNGYNILIMIGTSGGTFQQSGNTFNGNAILGTLDNYSLAFITSGTTALRITAGANPQRILIGEPTSALAKLQIRGQGNTSATRPFLITNQSEANILEILDNGDSRLNGNFYVTNQITATTALIRGVEIVLTGASIYNPLVYDGTKFLPNTILLTGSTVPTGTTNGSILRWNATGITWLEDTSVIDTPASFTINKNNGNSRLNISATDTGVSVGLIADTSGNTKIYNTQAATSNSSVTLGGGILTSLAQFGAGNNNMQLVLDSTSARFVNGSTTRFETLVGGQSFAYRGINISGQTSLNRLTINAVDIITTGATNNQALVFNGTNFIPQLVNTPYLPLSGGIITGTLNVSGGTSINRLVVRGIDIITTGATNNQALVFNGTNFIPTTIATTTTGASVYSGTTNGSLLIWDTNNQAWQERINGINISGQTSLNRLTINAVDIITTGASINQALISDGTNFIPQSIPDSPFVLVLKNSFR